jgi:D-Tyr-tRNAtyr deacylase
MKVCVQRVKKAKLVIEEKKIAEFESGMVVFVGFTQGDNLKN